MLLSLAAGLPVWGLYPVARRLRVLHVDLEQGDLTKRRYQRLARAMGVDLRALRDNLGAAIMPRIKIAPGEVRWIDLMMGRDVIVVDSLRAACGGSENDSEFRAALDMLGEISHATNCRPIVIHHAKKPSDDDTEARYSIRGSSAIYDAIDSGYVLSSTLGEPITVEHVKARSHGDIEEKRALQISDHAHGGDPKGGISVRAVGVEVAAAAKADREKEQRRAKAMADTAVIRLVLTRHPGLGSRELYELTQAEGVSKPRTIAALGTMGAELEKIDTVANNRATVRHFLRGASR
jgi:RecA-family ATPase